MKIKALIVDDERLARVRLRQLLDAEPDIAVTGECANGREAIVAIREHAPDLVFLDIQMPELDGFGVLDGLKGGSLPSIIFVTAFDKFAVKAFEAHALDYLLKPFDKARFQSALHRARRHLATRREDDFARQLAELAEEMKALKSGRSTPDRLAVKNDGRVTFVNVAEVDWVEAADNYVQLHVGAETHLLRETMANMETRLPPDKFIRISRSAIVNANRVKELQPLFHGDYAVILRDGAKLTLSRTHREKAMTRLGSDAQPGGSGKSTTHA